MVLTDEEAEQFYDLWISLLDFVNQKYKLIKELCICCERNLLFVERNTGRLCHAADCGSYIDAIQGCYYS